ncbi:MAG: AMP-binding protein [Oligoflexus sp.]|nr:AMP-binding protein [Oligoflexus sp.]
MKYWMEDDLVGSLVRQARLKPDALAFKDISRLFPSANPEGLSYLALDQKARSIAASLQAKKLHGARALLIYTSPLDFVASFYGCLYAGVVPVPAFPPDPARLSRTIPRLQAVALDASVSILLTTASALDLALPFIQQHPKLARLDALATDVLSLDDGHLFKPLAIDPETLAFIQYTSGSTSRPKGVMISHSQVIANCRQMLSRIEDNPEFADRFVSWVPLYHDFGLISSVLYSASTGASSYLMSPLDFLSDPLSWLENISLYQGTVTAAPNFAFELCVLRAQGNAASERVSRLDLSSWKMAMCGGEPISAQTMQKFYDVFREIGFSKQTLMPGFGLAESVVCATSCDANQPWTTRQVSREALKNGLWQTCAIAEDAQEFVSCGKALRDVKVKIVDPKSQQPLPEGVVGEIWLQGPNIATGYWLRPEESAEVFSATLAGSPDDPYLRTGDLGVLDEEQLYVTGRIKDLVIVAGRNIYPQDVEQSIEGSHPAVRPGTVAFFSAAVDDSILVTVLEVNHHTPSDQNSSVMNQVRSAVQLQHGLSLDAVVLIKPGTCLKTSSGKIQRQATRLAYGEASLSILGHWTKQEAKSRDALDQKDFEPDPVLAAPTRRRLAIIGGGPSGLVAASELVKLGTYDVTVYEKQKHLGGRSTDYFDFQGNQFSEVFIANDQYQSIQNLAASLGVAPMFASPRPPEKSRSTKSDLVSTYLIKPDESCTVAEYDRQKALTVELRPAEDQSEVLKVMTLAGYGYAETIPQAYRQLFASIGSRDAFDAFQSLMRPGFFLELWEALGQQLKSQSLTQILTETSVSFVSLEQDGRVRIRTDNDPDGQVFDQVLLSCLPKDALKVLDPRDFSTSRSLFQKLQYNRYGTLIFETDQDLPEASVSFPENFALDRMGRPLMIYRKGAVCYSLHYADVPGQKALSHERMLALLQEELAGLSIRLTKLVSGHFHSFFPHVSGEELKRGFYQDLEMLQGDKNLFYLGSLPGFELTETVARQATELVSRYFSPLDPEAQSQRVPDGNFEGVQEWLDLLRKFPSTPPQFGAFMPKYYTIDGSSATYCNASLSEIVLSGELKIAASAEVPAAVREGLWALSDQKFPLVASIKIVPDPQLRLRNEPKKYSYVLTLRMTQLPSNPTMLRGESSELELVFFSLSELFPIRTRDGIDILKAQLEGESASELFRRPDLKAFLDKAFQPNPDPLSVSFNTFGVPFIYDLGDSFGVLHLVPRKALDPRQLALDPSTCVRMRLDEADAIFDIKLQCCPKQLLPSVTGDMESPGWRQWNGAAPWCQTEFPLQTLGEIRFPKDLGLTIPEESRQPNCGTFFLENQWQKPTLLLPSGPRALVKIFERITKISKKEFDRINQNRAAESMIVHWASDLLEAKVRPEDNLLDRGISSLQLIQLAGYLETVFSISVPLTIFMDLPDIAAVGRYVQATAAGEVFATRDRIRVIPLHQGNRPDKASKQPSHTIFCLPPIIGSGDVYRPLSAELDEGIVLISLNDLLFYNQVPTVVMIPDLARAYTETIRELQPEGTIHLMGYSFGATLAYEVACHLRAEGRDVGRLIFLDGPAPNQMWTLAELNRDAIDPDTMTGKMITALLSAGSQYKPKAHAHPVQLIRARDAKIFVEIDDDTLGWKATTKEYQIHWVSGDHLSILRPPSVRDLASIVNQLMLTSQS